MVRFIRASLACVLVLLAGHAPLLASEVTRFERWYAVLLADQPVGWLHTTVTKSDQPPHAPPSVTTATKMKIAVRRGQSTMQISVGSWFVETVGGQPVMARSRQRLGQMQMTQYVRFRGDTVEWVRRQGDRYQKQVMPYPQVPPEVSHPQTPDGWLTPAAAQRLIQQRISEGAQEIRYWSFDPSLGTEPFETHMQIRGQEGVEVLGKVVPAKVCDTTVSKLPGLTTRVYLDTRGWMVKSTLSMIPGMSLTLVEADKQLATANIQPPELLASTLIKPNKPIAQPRKLQSAVYELSFALADDDPLGRAAGLPSSGFQQVDRRARGLYRISIDLNQPGRHDTDPPTESHLSDTAMLDGQDPKIRLLLHEALVAGPHNPTPTERTEAIRMFVNQYIHAKDLSVGLATASEVARTRQGDCTEHAVLLAAMLRAAGIPSRTVSGLIYVDRFLNQADVFGYHMWTQAWLKEETADNGRWIDLDATLNDRPFDAGHIALATSDMSDASMANDLVALVPIIGRLKIKVVDTTASPPNPAR